MKFGRKLAVERARCWPDACVDYKAIKRALKNDLAAGGARAAAAEAGGRYQGTKGSGGGIGINQHQMATLCCTPPLMPSITH